MYKLLLALISLQIVCIFAQDPADSWLVYAVTKGNGQRITWVNATWVVPAYPSTTWGSNAPGFWYGIEPEPAMDLIQPILAWDYTGAAYSIFNGYYQWDNDNWWFSETGIVKPGNHIYASVQYEASNDSYTMFITCAETGFSVYSNIPCEDGKIFTDLYFVIEHQPDWCKAYPANGYITFYDINIELDGKPATPKWDVEQYKPACNSNGQVISPSELKFTWSA